MRKKLRGTSSDWVVPTFANEGDIEVEASLLDLIDNVLNKGLALNGDLILGVANVDLIYVRLSVLLAALDKVAGDEIFQPIPASRKRGRPTSRARRKP